MMDSLSEQWKCCKEFLRIRLAHKDAEAWLPSLNLSYLGPQKAVFAGIPNTFFRNRIREKYMPLLREGLSLSFPELTIGDHFSLELHLEPQTRPGSSGNGSTRHDEQHGLGPSPGANGSAEPSTLHETRFSFENFLESPSNRLALQACREVAHTPGSRFNPLLVVGEVGLGKSHLMQAIVHQAGQNFPGMVVEFLSGEAFTNEVVDGIRTHSMSRVRKRFRAADMLLVDDVEFLAVSGKAQTELLHTLDALLALGKQVVLSADRFPAALSKFDPTLRSRLDMGLVTELGEPDSDLRLGIVQSRAFQENITLDDATARMLAERITSGPRQLVGTVVRLAAYASMLNRSITPEFVMEVAAPFFDREKGPAGFPPSGEAILGAVCDHFALTMKAVRSRNRKQMISKARRTAVYLLRMEGKLSFPEIGALLGNRTHSTIMESYKRVCRELEQDRPFARAIVKIRDELPERE